MIRRNVRQKRMSGTHIGALIGAIVAASGILAGCAPDATTNTVTQSLSGWCLWDCGNVYISNHPASDQVTLVACIIAVIACLILAATTTRGK